MRFPSRSSLALGPLALFLLLGVFLSTPIARFGKVHFSSAELLQDFTLTRVEPGNVSAGPLFSDAVTQTQPWTMFDRAEIAAGRVPLWNPWNGGGSPHLANHRSAVFSPFALPFYGLGFKAALLVSAFSKLFALGLFTYLFLRALRLSILPSLLGAVAFTFAGHNALLLSYPHVGAVVALPAGLFFAEKALQRFEAAALCEPGERRATARVRTPLVGLTLSLLAGLLAGHLESFRFAVLLVAAWWCARSAGIGLTMRAERRPMRSLAFFAGKFVLSAALAAGLGAFQLLPTFESWREDVVQGRSIHGQLPLESKFWPLALFPNALGHPSSGSPLSPEFSSSNYETVNLAYVGGTVLFLAVCSIVLLRRDRRIAFFFATGLAWVVLASGAFGHGAEPTEGSQAIWAFSTCCAAALTLDHVLRREPAPRWGRAILTALAGLGFLAAFRIGAQGLLDEHGSVSSPNHALFDAGVLPHLRHVSETFAAGIVALCLLLVVRETKLRVLGGCALVLVAFLQTGWLFQDYNPVCEDRRFFPATPAIRALRETVGTDRVAILGEDGLPPDVNLVYGIALARGSEGLSLRRFDTLYRDQFGEPHEDRPSLRESDRTCRTFGIPWILAKTKEAVSWSPGPFELVRQIGDDSLFRCRRSLGKYWTVEGSVAAKDDREAFELVRSPTFDPARLVVLSPPEDEEAAPSDLALALGARLDAVEPSAKDRPLPKVLEETPMWIRLEVSCKAPEFLVIAQSHYPGWKARVNGVERPVHRANYAFCAVELQSGLNVIDFSYEPESFRVGLWIGLASLLAGVLCLFPYRLQD